LAAPAFLLTNSADALMQLVSGGRSSISALALLGSSEDGVAGVLTPGRPQRIPAIFIAPPAGSVTFSLTANLGDDKPVDWTAMEPALRPSGVSDADWAAYMEAATNQVGTTWRGLLDGISLALRRKASPVNQPIDLRSAVGYTVGFAAEGFLHLQSLFSPISLDPQQDVQLRWTRSNATDCCTYVVTHGWFPDASMDALAQNIGQHCGKCRVVQVRWDDIARRLDAHQFIPQVAEEAFRRLTNQLGSGFDWNCVTFVGHSYGNSVNKEISKLAGGKGFALILDPPNPLGGSDTEFADTFERGSLAISTDSLFDTGPCMPKPRRVADRHVHLHTGRFTPSAHGAALHCLTAQLSNSTACDNRWLKGTVIVPPTQDGWFSGDVTCDGHITSPQYYACRDGDVPVPGTDIASGTSDVVRPIDPNDKLGPVGVGLNRIVGTQDELEYMVRFENFATASAPVQELILVDYLNTGLDWTTVRFKEIAYGDRIITPPQDSTSFTVRDMPPTNSISITGPTIGPMAIDVSAAVNPQIGRVEWWLRAIDTGTNLPPQDALAGFLPPENGTGRGQGHVRFTVKPKADVPVGTLITNKASIVFDFEAPIETPTVWNTIGSEYSVSASIAYLPGQIAVGVPFTYAIGLTNNGTNIVPNVILTNAPPSSVTVLDAIATHGTVTVTNDTVIWSLGTVTNGFGGVLTVTAVPSQEGTFTNNVFYSSGSGLAFYSAPSEVTVVPSIPPRLSIGLARGQIELAWPTNSVGFRLQRAFDIGPSAVWETIAAEPLIFGEEFRVILAPTNDAEFFRLIKP
jgi:hypothetical protein